MIKTFDDKEIKVGMTVYSVSFKTGELLCGEVKEIINVSFPGAEGSVERPIIEYPNSTEEWTNTPSQLSSTAENARARYLYMSFKKHNEINNNQINEY